MSLALRGGLLVGPGGAAVADVVVGDDGKVTAVGEGIGAGARRQLDVAGAVVLPGGVDPHVHVDSPARTALSCDDFEHATAAAAAGGTTTIIAFAEQDKGERLRDTFARWRAKVDAAPLAADVALHIAVGDASVDGLHDDLAALAADGAPSVKLFFAYKGAIMVADADFLRIAQTAARSGATVLIHAENGDAVDVLTRQALAAGHRDLIWHARTRPPLVEAEATARAIALARLAGARLYVVHVTCAEALEPIARARAAGLPVWGETCPQYLLLDESGLEGPVEQAVRYVFTPPPRPAREQDALWRALADGTLSAVGSDHCPYLLAERRPGACGFADVVPGAPGVETRLPLLYGRGVGERRLGLERLAAVTSSAPAWLFGLAPAKGALEPGADADLVVIDPEGLTVPSADTQRSRADYSLYEGWRVPGRVETVLLRGVAVVEEGRLTGRAPGRFVARPPARA